VITEATPQLATEESQGSPILTVDAVTKT